VDCRVIAGNGDGAVYAIGANGTSDQGQLLWKFQTGGMIDVSAAYKDGVVYIASNDNHAYAIRADTGESLWQSEKLPGDGFHSCWLVLYQDDVSLGEDWTHGNQIIDARRLFIHRSNAVLAFGPGNSIGKLPLVPIQPMQQTLVTPAMDEGVMQPLHDRWMFLAKAYVMKESRAQLTKYLDEPAFEKGDLMFINNLIAAIESP
jgi:hypothetical protein